MTPSENPSAPAPRSPFIDWVAALSRGIWTLLALLIAGSAIGSVPLLLDSSRGLLASTVVVLVEPDLLGAAVAKTLGVVVDRDDGTLARAARFEVAARSEKTLEKAIKRVAKDGVDPAEQFGIGGGGDPADRTLLAAIVEARLAFDYRARDPRIVMTVSARSGEFARDFAKALAEETIAQIDGELAFGRVAELQTLRGRKRALGEELAKLNKDMADLQATPKPPAAQRALLARQMEDRKVRIDFLSAVERKYQETSQLVRPAYRLAGEPTIPTRPAPGRRRLLLPIGGAVAGLLIGLMRIGYALHVEMMRELNPARYGRRS